MFNKINTYTKLICITYITLHGWWFRNNNIRHQDNTSMDTITDCIIHIHIHWCVSALRTREMEGNRQAHYHSTPYIKCYGNIIHFISSYTFPQQLLSVQEATCLGLGHGWWYSSGAALCARLCVRARVSVCDVNSGARCAEISPWLYLVNAAATDKSFISLILSYKPWGPCYTLPVQFTHSAQHKDTASPPPPPPPPLLSSTPPLPR